LLKLNAAESVKHELRSLGSYLRTQALCDADRRDRQQEPAQAATRFVRSLYQAAIQASLQQPQTFWATLEAFANQPLEVNVRPREEPKKPAPLKVVKDLAPQISKAVDEWDAKDLFQHLLSEVERQPSSKQKDVCVAALKTLVTESKRAFSQRNPKKDLSIWKTYVFPHVESQKLMLPFKKNKLMKEKLHAFFRGL
jgi:hypothetical protein